MEGTYTYKGMVTSASFNGEAEITVNGEGMVMDSLFANEAVDFGDVVRIDKGDFEVKVTTAFDQFFITRLGNSWEWFYNDLAKGYNGAVTTALLIEGGSDFETKGKFAFDGKQMEGVIAAYGDCFCLLPPQTPARRIPYVFINGMRKENYALTVSLVTGEEYTISMVGRDLDPLEKRIADRVRNL